jgi:septal ring factor EnvC (AmiA/AmiB activator)
VSPGEAGTAITRSILLRETLPGIEARARRIAGEIEVMNALEAAIRQEQQRLADAEASIALRRQQIESLTQAKRSQYEGLSGSSAELRSRARLLGEQAGTLRELLAGLEAEAPQAPGMKPDAPVFLAALRPRRDPGLSVTPSAASARPGPLGEAARAGLVAPVSGTVINRFGDRLAGGSRAEWISYRTRSQAQVQAPAGGRVEYARPFRSYGSMLILRTSDGYHVILTGMGRIYVSEGQSVNAGEPVGRMPERVTPPPELTLELRLGDRVLDPAQWMADRG